MADTGTLINLTISILAVQIDLHSPKQVVVTRWCSVSCDFQQRCQGHMIFYEVISRVRSVNAPRWFLWIYAALAFLSFLCWRIHRTKSLLVDQDDISVLATVFRCGQRTGATFTWRASCHNVVICFQSEGAKNMPSSASFVITWNQWLNHDSLRNSHAYISVSYLWA